MRVDDESSAVDSAWRCPITDVGREFNPFVDPYLGNPYAVWLHARQAEPVFYSPELHYWVVTRYADIKSNAKTHLSFGFGIHYCLGAPLARLELKVILAEMTRRLPSLRWVPGQTCVFPPNTSFRGPAQWWAEWQRNRP